MEKITTLELKVIKNFAHNTKIGTQSVHVSAPSLITSGYQI